MREERLGNGGMCESGSLVSALISQSVADLENEFGIAAHGFAPLEAK